MFFLLSSVWTDEASCTILNSTVVQLVNCSYSCGPECRSSSSYSCLQVYISLNSTGRVLLLLHDEEMPGGDLPVTSYPTALWQSVHVNAVTQPGFPTSRFLTFALLDLNFTPLHSNNTSRHISQSEWAGFVCDFFDPIWKNCILSFHQ